MVNGITTAFQRVVLWVGFSAVVSACAVTVVPELPKPVTGGMRFTLSAPDAKTVCVVGSFNGWVKGTMPMKRAGDRGLWVTEVTLRPGEYTFMYVVDDNEWMVPPLAEDFVMDGFGQTNGVVIVR
jgi:1,4-alpha-glucan branching enzyme